MKIIDEILFQEPSKLHISFKRLKNPMLLRMRKVLKSGD